MNNSELKEALSFFAKRFHRGALTDLKDNYISSPIGAWILLAQFAGANPKALNREQTERIENALGMPLAPAFDYANTLIKTAPPAIKAAAAAWFKENYSHDEVGAEWVANTQESGAVLVEHRIPSKEELDAWAKENTLGIIDTFPATPTTATIFILANALATKIAWLDEFEEIENTTGFWNTKTLLSSPENIHRKRFVEDEEGNLYAVLTANGESISVHAVIANDVNTPKEKVIETAERIAAGDILKTVSPHDIISEGAIYSIFDDAGYKGDLYEATLPAWTAESRHDLLEIGLPYSDGMGAISAEDDLEIEALQVAKASYNKKGFEAAAVSVVMMRTSGLPSLRSIKKVKLFFNHPFAVVANHTHGHHSELNLWESLPVFSAWVNKATEVESD